MKKILGNRSYSDIVNRISDNIQVHGTKSVSLCGRVPGKSFCRNLGYPQNQRTL